MHHQIQMLTKLILWSHFCEHQGWDNSLIFHKSHNLNQNQLSLSWIQTVEHITMHWKKSSSMVWIVCWYPWVGLFPINHWKSLRSWKNKIVYPKYSHQELPRFRFVGGSKLLGLKVEAFQDSHMNMKGLFTWRLANTFGKPALKHPSNLV